MLRLRFYRTGSTHPWIDLAPPITAGLEESRVLRFMEEADQVGYVGDSARANILSAILPASMRVTPMEPGTTLGRMLGYLGYPDAVLDAINAAGAEELFAQARAA